MKKNIFYFNILFVLTVCMSAFSMQNNKDDSPTKRPAAEQIQTKTTPSPKKRKSSMDDQPFPTLNVLADTSPLKSPNANANTTPPTTPRASISAKTTPEAPSFNRMDIASCRNSVAIFEALMSYFIINICELGCEQDPFVAFVKTLFTVTENGLTLSSKCLSIDNARLKEHDYLTRYLDEKFKSLENHDYIIDYIRSFCFRMLKCSLNKEVRRNLFSEFVAVRGASSSSSSSSSDDGRLVFNNGSINLDFEDDESFNYVAVDTNAFSDIYKQLRDDNNLKIVASIFDKINQNNKYKNYLLGAGLDSFNSDNFSSVNQAIEFITACIKSQERSNFCFVYNVLNKLLATNKAEQIESIKNVYCACVDLIKGNLKESSFLLPYDYKYILLFAKKIKESSDFNCTLDLDSIVLIKDDHILDLVYEEKHKNPGEYHLAGGHFAQENNMVLQNNEPGGQAYKLTSFEVLTACPSCDIKYVRFHVNEKLMNSCTAMCDATTTTMTTTTTTTTTADSLLAREKCKDSTLFPTCIKSRCHEYFKCLFDVALRNSNVAGVQCLMKNTKSSDKSSFCLFKHKRSFFDNFSHSEMCECTTTTRSDHAVYVAMVIFNEDGVNVIWTCYLLGVYIIDWDEAENYLKNEILLGKGISKESISAKIYDSGNISQKEDDFLPYYFFEENAVKYCLVRLCDGIYLKLKKSAYDVIFEKARLEAANKKAANRNEKKNRQVKKRSKTKQNAKRVRDLDK